MITHTALIAMATIIAFLIYRIYFMDPHPRAQPQQAFNAGSDGPVFIVHFTDGRKKELKFQTIYSKGGFIFFRGIGGSINYIVPASRVLEIEEK